MPSGNSSNHKHVMPQLLLIMENGVEMTPIVTPLFTDCLYGRGCRCDFGVHVRLEPDIRAYKYEGYKIRIGGDISIPLHKNALYSELSPYLVNQGVYKTLSSHRTTPLHIGGGFLDNSYGNRNIL